MAKGFMYLYEMIDVYSRYIMAWDISNSMTAELLNSQEIAISIDGKGRAIDTIL